LPIEFYCPDCDAFLRTPDAKAGASSRCPSCRCALWVPLESDPVEEESWYETNAPNDSHLQSGLNSPDRSPSTNQNRVEQGSLSSPNLRSRLPSEDLAIQSGPTLVNDVDFIDDFDDVDGIGDADPNAKGKKGLWCEKCRARLSPGSSFCEECESHLMEPNSEIRPATFRHVLAVSLKLYSENYVLCMAASLIDLVMMCIAILLVFVPAMMVAAIVGRNGPIAFPAMLFVFFFGLLVSFSTLWVGQIRFFHALARGQNPSIKEMFQIGPMTGRMAAATLLYCTVLMVGGMVFFIPGIIAAVVLWPYGRFLIDNDCDSSECLVGAANITSRNFVCSSLVLLVFGLVAWLATAIPLGIFFVRPFQSLFFSVAYLHMKGEFVTGEKQLNKADLKPGLLRSS